MGLSVNQALGITLQRYAPKASKANSTPRSGDETFQRRPLEPGNTKHSEQSNNFYISRPQTDIFLLQ